MPKNRLPPTLIPLLKHISSGNYFSGEELAAHFSLSRATIFNLLKVAQDHGLRINAVRGKGYQLARSISWLDADLLEASIRQLALDYTLLLSDTAESTNSWLMDEAISGATHRTIAYADYQFAGRGRRGRVWQSPLGGSLTFSVLWRFDRGISQLSGLSIVAGMALARAINKFSSIPVKLKWPNDLLAGYRKLAGILVEVQGEMMGPSFAIIGIGINDLLSEKHRHEIDQAVVDLSELNVTVKREELVLSILKELSELMKIFEQNGLGTLLEEWSGWHVHEGKAVVVRNPDGTLCAGIANGLDESGNLILTCTNGEQRKFSVGEVSLRPLSKK